jgi:hypothetical protein
MTIVASAWPHLTESQRAREALATLDELSAKHLIGYAQWRWMRSAIWSGLPKHVRENLLRRDGTVTP